MLLVGVVLKWTKCYENYFHSGKGRTVMLLLRYWCSAI